MTIRHRGYIALVSVVLLAAALLSLILAASVRGFYARLDALQREYHAQALENARACLAQSGVAFMETATVAIHMYALPKGNCSVDLVEKGTEHTTVAISGVYENAGVSLRALFANTTALLVSVEEIPS